MWRTVVGRNDHDDDDNKNQCWTSGRRRLVRPIHAISLSNAVHSIAGSERQFEGIWRV